MTRKEFERATSALKESVCGEHYMAVELINGKEQAIYNSTHEAIGCCCDWDDEMCIVSNMGMQVAAFPLAAVVKVFVH